MRKIALVASALILAALIGGGIAYASIPGPDGTIHGCYKTSNPGQGALITIDSAASCPSGFTALNWRQVTPTVVTSPAVSIAFDAGGVNGTAVACATGQTVVGGGATANTSDPLVLTSTWPLVLNGSTPAGWQAIWRNTSTSALSAQVTVYAVCAGP